MKGETHCVVAVVERRKYLGDRTSVVGHEVILLLKTCVLNGSSCL